jgi:hypothetical protein
MVPAFSLLTLSSHSAQLNQHSSGILHALKDLPSSYLVLTVLVPP